MTAKLFEKSRRNKIGAKDKCYYISENIVHRDVKSKHKRHKVEKNIFELCLKTILFTLFLFTLLVSHFYQINSYIKTHRFTLIEFNITLQIKNSKKAYLRQKNNGKQKSSERR